MLYLKGCPRCGGDLLFQEETHGEPQLSCLQCGYAVTASRVAARWQRPPAPMGVGRERVRRTAA